MPTRRTVFQNSACPAFLLFIVPREHCLTLYAADASSGPGLPDHALQIVLEFVHRLSSNIFFPITSLKENSGPSGSWDPLLCSTLIRIYIGVRFLKSVVRKDKYRETDKYLISYKYLCHYLFSVFSAELLSIDSGCGNNQEIPFRKICSICKCWCVLVGCTLFASQVCDWNNVIKSKSFIVYIW